MWYDVVVGWRFLGSVTIFFFFFVSAFLQRLVAETRETKQEMLLKLNAGREMVYVLSLCSRLFVSTGFFPECRTSI